MSCFVFIMIEYWARCPMVGPLTPLSLLNSATLFSRWANIRRSFQCHIPGMKQSQAWTQSLGSWLFRRR